VPQAIFKEDMQRLVTQLQLYKPEQVIVIGDMFHSDDNKEHAFFVKWRKDFEQLSIMLVKGNHDVLKDEWYAAARIQLCIEQQGEDNCTLRIGNFIFTHDITGSDLTGGEQELYFFSGHIHPGISIRGIGKQSLRFPCFYFGEKFAVLPAFGRFTGTHGIEPKRGESVYALIPANYTMGNPGGIMKV
jgi:DNA ligase-associated metallophosphoesterase